MISKLSKKLFALILTAMLLLSSSISAFAEETYSLEAAINSMELNPTSTNSPELDAYLDSLLASITTDEMTTYEKLTSCFEYIIANTSYASHMRYLGSYINGVTCSSIYRQFGEVEGFGAVVLASGKGMCNAYASAWMLLAQKIGVSSKLVEGSTRSGRGGYSYHKWAEVVVDGVTYVVDPQLQQSLRRYWANDYSVYFSTYSQIPGRYVKY